MSEASVIATHITRRGEYLRIPNHRAGGTGGREYGNSERISRIRKMATTGEFDPPDVLSRFAPLHDEKPVTAPYPIEERLIVVPDSKDQRIITPDDVDLSTILAPSLELSQPTIIGEHSYGATVEEEHIAAAQAAENLKLIFGIGEGGWCPKIRHHKRIMVQVASGVFGITAEVLQDAIAISVKMAQIAKGGSGGHVKAHKITKDMADTRGMPLGIDYISDANRIFSIEEVRQIVHSVRKASKGKPVFIKCAATHDLAAIVAGSIEAGADGVIIDGRGGGTAAAPIILRNRLGIPIELAVALADTIRKEKGAENFKIIAAGRVYLPAKAMKLALLGADAIMSASGVLISTGCLMVHQCHKKCPPLVATANIQRDGSQTRLDPDWATHVLSSYMRSYGQALAAYTAYLGFPKFSDAVGRRDLLRGIALDPELAELLGVESLSDHTEVGAEIRTLWQRDVTDPFYPWQLDHIKYLRETGTIEIGSMGRTNDLDPPNSYLDALMIEGRHVVGPSYDVYRDTVETVTSLPGNVRLDMPMMVSVDSKDTAIDILKAAASRRTVVVMRSELLSELIGDVATRKDILSRLDSVVLKISEGEEEKIEGKDMYMLRNVAGIIIPHTLANQKFVRYVGTYTDRPVYANVPATGKIKDDVIAVAKSGISGIIIEGKVGIRDFDPGQDFGTDKSLPLEVAVPVVDDLLSSRSNQGKILRSKLAVIAQGNVRTPDDVYMMCALGSNAVVNTSLLDFSGKDVREGTEKLLDGYRIEMQVEMGAGGVSMISSVIGNRDLLRADEMPPKIRELMGVSFMGK